MKFLSGLFKIYALKIGIFIKMRQKCSFVKFFLEKLDPF